MERGALLARRGIGTRFNYGTCVLSSISKAWRRMRLKISALLRDADPGARRALADISFGWFRTVWGANEVRPRRLFAVFFAGMALICGATSLMGAVPTRLFGHDIFFLLDNGWRVINGQRPHLDYYSPWGPVTFLVVAAGLKISGYSVDGIGYGNALAAFIMGSWTFYVAKNRLTPPLRLLLSFFLAVLVAAPYA